MSYEGDEAGVVSEEGGLEGGTLSIDVEEVVGFTVEGIEGSNIAIEGSVIGVEGGNDVARVEGCESEGAHSARSESNSSKSANSKNFLHSSRSTSGTEAFHRCRRCLELRLGF